MTRRRRRSAWSPPGPPTWLQPPRPRRRRRSTRGLDPVALLALLILIPAVWILTLATAGRVFEAIALAGVFGAVALAATSRGRAIVRWTWRWRRRRAYVERRRREQVPPGLRFRVFQRDGFRCTYCGRTAAASELQADHVVPVALGGGTELENLVTACGTCNLGKSAIPVV